MEILEALKQLDPANDEHWTEDGLPSVATVQDIVGDKVTRAQILDAAPEFNRSVVLNEDTPDGETSDTPPEPEAEAVESEYDRLVALRNKTEEELIAVAKQESDLKEERNALERKVHSISTQMDQVRPADEGQQAITNYLARQKEVTADRAARRKLLQDAGVGELMKGIGKAPIDEAMNKRKPARGSQRPVVSPKS